MRLGLGLGVNSITSQKIGAGFTGILDEYSGAAAAYSVRRLSSTYTDGLIRVRRSSDDAEQDIGFDANGDLDTTALTTFVNADVDTYTSDFSSTEDLSENNGTGAAAQSVGGVDDAYKFTTITGTGQMFARPSASPFSGKGGSNSFRVQADVYLPSTNAEIDGIRIWTGYGTEIFSEVTTTDSWVSVDQTLSLTQGSNLYFSAKDGANLIPTTTGANVFYLKNIVVTQTTADGAVTTFYDQSGNGNDATNSTESEQPLVVSAGTLVTENGKAALDFDGVDDWLDAGLSSSQFSQAFVVKNTTGTGTVIGYSGAVSLQSSIYNTLDDDITFSGDSGLYTIDNLNVKGYLNGVDETGAATTFTQTFNRLYFGSVNGTSSFIDGKIQEYIHFPYASDQSTNRTGIETNINDHFDIYP